MPSSDPEWLSTRERGSAFGIRLLVFAITVGGRWFVRLWMWPVALYFVVFSGKVRRGLRAYYQRLEGSRASFWKLYRHVRRFANVAVDRFFLVKGRFELFEITETGREHIEKVLEEKTGAILLAAHIGSFEAMRAMSRHVDIPLNVVGYFRNARAFNEALEKYDPGCNVRLIEIETGGVSFVFKIKQCIERGELVAILGDRVGLSGQTVTVDFLGEPARFAAGVYGMASVLRCPVYMTAAVYSEPNRYDLFCEPFAELVVLPRGDRQAAMARYAQKYADRMEHFCRIAPDNWFNFFDYWDDPGEPTLAIEEAA